MICTLIKKIYSNNFHSVQTILFMFNAIVAELKKIPRDQICSETASHLEKYITFVIRIHFLKIKF